MKIRLTLDIVYEKGSENHKSEIVELLNQFVCNGYTNGSFSGDLPAEVSCINHKIELISRMYGHKNSL
jgi:hypothetical protein